MVDKKIDARELAAEIRDTANVIWQGEPDQGSFFVGQTRAMRLKFAVAVVAGVVAAALAALPAAAIYREWGTAPASGGGKELAIMDLIGNEVYFACFTLGLVATAAGAFLAARRSRKMAGRVTYYLTKSAIIVFEGVRAARYDLELIAGVERRPGGGGGARGDVRVELQPTGDDRTLGEVGETVLIYGVEDPERVCILLKRAWMDRLRQVGGGIFDHGFADDYGNTHLMHEVAKGDLEKVQALIAAGARVDAANSAERTPLMSAAQSGRRDIVSCLLAANADVSVTDLNDKTALDYAIESGDAAIAELLRNRIDP